MSNIEREPFGTQSAYMEAIESGKDNMMISCELVVELVEALRAARQAPASGEVEPVAWVTPLAYGQQVTFYKPSMPAGFNDNEAGVTWYCRPLVYADTHPPAKVPEALWEALAECVSCFNCPEWSDKCEEVERRATKLLNRTTPKPATTPQPAQQRSVPEGFCLDGGHRTLKANTGVECSCPKYVRHPHCARYESRGLLPKENPWLTTPQPESDGWIRCEDRLPTEADADIFGNVWCSGFWDNPCRGIAPINWTNVGKGNAGDTHWKPTGLKRPQPPREQEGE